MAYLRIAAGGVAVFVLLGATREARADCYVDSQGGNDSLGGQSEAEAVQSQAAMPSGCTVIRYKRGSVFKEPVKMPGFGSSSSVTYTNYGDTSQPLPVFDVTGATPETATQSVVSSFGGGGGGIVIDGLHLKGSHGDGTMNGLTKGVCVTMSGNSKLLNNEIDACDIGIMLSGSGSLVQGNLVHDLRMAVDAAADSGTYVNAVGGAEGIFINGSNNEIAYNQFINCSDTAEWTGGSCDGGATEVTVGSSGVSGVKVHHNFSYNSCGFFEVSGAGTFSDSEFYYNVSVDSGWMFLLQINETTLSNIRWENNTIVQHEGSTNAGFVSMIYTGGQGTTGALSPNTVFFNNNLVILDNVSSFGDIIDTAISQSNNLIVKLPADPDPGVVNVKGTDARSFDLLETSPARDQGMTIASHTLDFLDRAVPDSSGKTDIGAFECGSSGGSSGTGGSSPTLTGGAGPTGGTTAAATGGSPSATGGASTVTPTGGTSTTATGGASSVTVTGGTSTGTAVTGGSGPGTPTSTGGQTTGSSSGGSQAATSSGGASATGSQKTGGADSDAGPSTGGSRTGNAASLGVGDAEGACGCRTVGNSTGSRPGLGALLGLLVGALIVRRRRTAAKA